MIEQQNADNELLRHCCHFVITHVSDQNIENIKSYTFLTTIDREDEDMNMITAQKTSFTGHYGPFSIHPCTQLTCLDLAFCNSIIDKTMS